MCRKTLQRAVRIRLDTYDLSLHTVLMFIDRQRVGREERRNARPHLNNHTGLQQKQHRMEDAGLDFPVAFTEPTRDQLALCRKAVELGRKRSEFLHHTTLLINIQVDSGEAPFTVPTFKVPTQLSRVRNRTVKVDWQQVKAEALKYWKSSFKDQLGPCCPSGSSNPHRPQVLPPSGSARLGVGGQTLGECRYLRQLHGIPL
jgi:hypothetical protein